jgi:anti-anti-sigma factor
LSCAVESLEDGTVRVALVGELDPATASKADRALRAALGCASLVIVDLRGLAFIGATTTRVLLAADARARYAGGHLAVMPGPTLGRADPELAQLYRRLETLDPGEWSLREAG